MTRSWKSIPFYSSKSESICIRGSLITSRAFAAMWREKRSCELRVQRKIPHLNGKYVRHRPFGVTLCSKFRATASNRGKKCVCHQKRSADVINHLNWNTSFAIMPCQWLLADTKKRPQKKPRSSRGENKGNSTSLSHLSPDSEWMSHILRTAHCQRVRHCIRLNWQFNSACCRQQSEWIGTATVAHKHIQISLSAGQRKDRHGRWRWRWTEGERKMFCRSFACHACASSLEVWRKT